MYYRRIENLETISNRLQEVPPINSLSGGQIHEFITRGFVDQLGLQLSRINVELISRHVEYVTLGIAQRIHEYCEILGHCIEDHGGTFASALFEDADRKYMHSALRKSYAVIDSFMNERKTRAGRRNQVLFSLGKISNTEFEASRVESILRHEFPESTHATTLAVGQMMADLASGDAPLLRRSGKVYRFSDPRFLMCIRVMLRKTTGERVLKFTFRR